MKDILIEIDSIKKRSQKSVNELHGLYDFFRIFTKTFKKKPIASIKDYMSIKRYIKTLTMIQFYQRI